MRHRRGFTILELLIAVGVIAILMAITMPLLWRVRGAAMKVICSARLRDLTMATTMYQQQNRVYPQPMHKVYTSGGTATVRPAPQRISGDLLNQLRDYLTFPELDSTTSVADLPAFVQCPFVEGEAEGRGPYVSATLTGLSYYTGYSYLGRVSEVATPAPATSSSGASAPQSSSGLGLGLVNLPINLPNVPALAGLIPTLEPAIELKPGRAASAREQRRAVLWADNVYQLDPAGLEWKYGHTESAVRTRGARIYRSADQLLGQHRSFTDGSVEWVKSGSDELDVSKSYQTKSTASLRTMLGEYWWF